MGKDLFVARAVEFIFAQEREKEQGQLFVFDEMEVLVTEYFNALEIRILLLIVSNL